MRAVTLSRVGNPRSRFTQIGDSFSGSLGREGLQDALVQRHQQIVS